MKRKKIKQLLIKAALLSGVLLMLWNCTTDSNEPETVSAKENTFQIPNIADAKNTFEILNENNDIFRKKQYSKDNEDTIDIDIDWEFSTGKHYKEDVDILYSPITYQTTIRMKSFVASVLN